MKQVKSIIGSIFVIGVMLMLMGTATQSYFSDTETSTGNTFTAGTIDLAVDDKNPWTRTGHEITLDAKPCQTFYDTITLQNVGENNFNVWKHIKNVVCVENGIIEPEQEYYNTHGIGSLRGYWRFEEGTPWNGISGEVTDRSCYENHGTAYNGAIQYNPGKVGQCAEFDGDNDYVEVNCGPGSSLNLENAVTIEAWVQSTTAGSYDYVIAKYYDGGKASYALDTDSAKARFYVTTNGGYHQVTSNLDIWDGNWHHLAGTYDKGAGAGNIKLYIDGNLVSSGTTAGVMDVNSNMNFYIGNYGTGSSFSFPGLIDEVAVWDRALPLSEIKDHHDNPGIIEGSGNDIDSVILYDMWIDNDGVPGFSGNDKWLIHELDGLHIDDIECNYIYLGMIPAGGEMTIVQSYHMEADTGNWAQSDKMTFTIEFYAEQLACDGNGGMGPHEIRKEPNLPDFEVKAKFRYPGPDSYWDVEILEGQIGPEGTCDPDGVPYNVWDGHWVDWCIDETHYIYNGATHEITLWCSYDPNLPLDLQDNEWPYVNWIINHKGSANKNQIQDAIWYFIDGGWAPYKNPGHPNYDQVIQDLIDDAENNPYGLDYYPTINGLFAVICDAGPTIQRTFIEVDP